MAAPSGVTELEQQALREIAHKMGARYVFIEQEAKMAALGLGVSINKPRGRLVVDVGGGTTDIAVVAAGDIVAGDSIKVAGNYIDREIQKLIRTKYNVAIGLLTAEKIKRSLSGLLDVEGEERIGAYGRNVSTGLPTVFGVDPRDIRKLLLDDAVARIVNAIAQLLEITPPELAADIKQSGIYLCGGGALLKGLDLFLEEKFKLPVTIAPQPLLSVIEGTKLFERQIVEILQYDDDGGVYVDN
jgi:rod shape-determining protein MreB